MDIYSLPDDIYADQPAKRGPTSNPISAPASSPVIFHHYASKTVVFKEKSILTRNAISLVIEGQKTMQFTEKTVHINDNEIHMMTAGHCIANMDMKRNKLFESILIFFDNSELANFYAANTALIEKLTRQHKDIQPSPYVSIAKDDFIRTYISSLQAIIKKSSQPGQPSEAMRRIKLYELLLYLLESHPTSFLAFQQNAKLTDVELMIRRVVESNILSNLTLEEMSFLCNQSLSTFKRQFKKLYNTSPTAWFLEQKMNIAARLLRQGREKPGEIWFKLGFETHTGFTKSFKRHFGTTPAAYSGDKKANLTFQE